jgi:hypothetical protein
VAAQAAAQLAAGQAPEQEHLVKVTMVVLVLQIAYKLVEEVVQALLVKTGLQE